MTIEAKLLEVGELTCLQRDDMYALMAQYYENMDRDEFNADLDEKQWVIYISAPDTDRICGFSTQTLLEVAVGTKTIRALYSGDTIMDQHYRASNSLTQTWGRLALSLMDRFPEGELYWFLISKGYKTYRFLPVFFNEFYPRYDREAPPWASQAIGALACHKFDNAYDQEAGVVRARKDGCRLRKDVASITEGRLKDPHVAFFVDANPEHALGDELCCVAPLTPENFKAAAYRAIGVKKGDPAAPL